MCRGCDAFVETLTCVTESCDSPSDGLSILASSLAGASQSLLLTDDFLISSFFLDLKSVILSMTSTLVALQYSFYRKCKIEEV